MKKICKIAICFLLCLSVCLSFCACNKKSTIDKASKNLSCYTIDAVLGEDSKSLSATMCLDYVNNTDSVLNNLCFNLFGTAFSDDAQILPYTKLSKNKCYVNGESFGDMQILEVFENGEASEFEIVGQDKNVLKVALKTEIFPDSKTQIKIKFGLTLANCAHRLGYLNNSVNLCNWFPILCVYEKGEFKECAYYATGDPFYSECANFKVKITYPNNFDLVATGNNLESVVSTNFVCDTFEAKCVRDFSAVLCSNFEKVSEDVDGVIVNYYGYEGDENLQSCLQISKKALMTFSEKFGEYPYKVLNVVKTPFMHGGMEYPNLVLISDSITDEDYFLNVIVHEIAHQWWYGVVGNNEIEEAWLDEALAEFSTALFYKFNPEFNKSYADVIKQNEEGYLLYIDVVKSVGSKPNEQMNLKVFEYANEYEYTYMVYVKGVLMFDNLMQTIGEDKFLESLKLYYSQNMFKIAKRDNLIACFEQTTKTSMTGFFDSWLNGKVNIIQTKN